MPVIDSFMTPKTVEHIAQKTPTHTGEGVAVTDLIRTIFRTNVRIMQPGDVLLFDLNILGARSQVPGAVEQTPRTVAQIARHYELSPQRVLWHAQALIEEGTVELVKNPDHRRARLVELAAQGRHL